MASEKRLIDANALLQDNEEYFCKPCKEKGHDYHEVACRACWVDDMRISIEDAPTVDAVEVVRCKDCRYAKDMLPLANARAYQMGVCTVRKEDGIEFTVWEHDFCSYGERKDNE